MRILWTIQALLPRFAENVWQRRNHVGKVYPVEGRVIETPRVVGLRLGQSAFHAESSASKRVPKRAVHRGEVLRLFWMSVTA